ncbi:MAG: hypothetical protein F4Y86_08400 [Gammaproteobacteria bacterium]|nr:hypothetical protein [Gammaproteobacteria bacterium]
MTEEQYTNFIASVKNITTHAIDLDANASGREHAERLCKMLFEVLELDRTRTVMCHAAAAEPPIVRNAFAAELGLFNARYPNDADIADARIPKALKDADTVKNSFHAVFKIPDWLDKILHILNELLKLLRP